MNDRTLKDDELEEKIPDQFLCCVCRELLHKPIVLPCGHSACFWCVLKSMNGLSEAHCAKCGEPYVHFSSFCQNIHFLLKKLYPVAYKKREEQVLKEERDRNCYSPQNFVVVDEQKHVSEDDLLCSACKKLLVQPVVLNCGHVYCAGCVIDMAGENEKIECGECQVNVPRGLPKVCLVIEQLLEDNFPEKYNRNLQETLAYNKRSFQTCCVNKDVPLWKCPTSNVHIGVGCDSCGIYPIFGARYKCKDCTEEFGYDLCKDCYHTRSKLPGRFNQQHTSDHVFDLVEISQMRKRRKGGLSSQIGYPHLKKKMIIR